MTTQIIALIGAAGAGKTTVSKQLEKRYGFNRFRFAGTLKAMLKVLGLTDAQVDGNEKHIPADVLCGRTPRHAMQTLGTEWRDMIHPHLWTNVMEKHLTDFIADRNSASLVGLPPPAFIVIDDLRFFHELEMIKRLGGEVWCIRRAEVEPGIVQRSVSKLPKFLRGIVSLALSVKPLHPSEIYWMDMEPDVTIWNNGTEEELIETVNQKIEWGGSKGRTPDEQPSLF